MNRGGRTASELLLKEFRRFAKRSVRSGAEQGDCTGGAQIVKEKQDFERVEVSREEALSMFAENPFKEEIIRGLAEEATISLYRCGPMVDLCHGPHLPNTGFLKSAAVSAMNRAFWRADVNREPLQVTNQRHYHNHFIESSTYLVAWLRSKQKQLGAVTDVTEHAFRHPSCADADETHGTLLIGVTQI